MFPAAAPFFFMENLSVLLYGTPETLFPNFIFDTAGSWQVP